MKTGYRRVSFRHGKQEDWRFMIQLPRYGDEWLEVKEFDDEEYERLRPIVEGVDRANRRMENGIRAKLEPIAKP